MLLYRVTGSLPSNQTDFWCCRLGAKSQERHSKRVLVDEQDLSLPKVRSCPEKHRIGEIRASFLTSKELDPSHSAPGPRRSSTVPVRPLAPMHLIGALVLLRYSAPTFSLSKLEFRGLLFAFFFVRRKRDLLIGHLPC